MVELVLGARTAGKNLTCVWCRAKWILAPSGPGASAASGSMTSEGYMNLGNVAGMDTTRDTSSCTHYSLTAYTTLTVDVVQIITGQGKDDDIMGIRIIGNRSHKGNIWFVYFSLASSSMLYLQIKTT
jgi:hypothetical protein